MANLQTQSFSATVSNFASTVQGAAAALLNFTTGSVLRAIADATAGVSMWLQGLIISLLAVTRLSTSTGADVDTWLADFDFYRLAANAATGLVIFSRLTNTTQAVIPVGTIVQTGDGTQQFIINADTTNPAYSATVISGGGFVIAAGTSSLNVTATAITPGASGMPDSTGNVAANTITALASAIPYVDSVTNSAAFINGANPETDAAVKVRFVLWLNSLAKGTSAAIYAAVAGVQQGLTSSVIENYLVTGAYQPGAFTVIIDDGTGYPSSNLQNNVSNAIAASRPLCSSWSVHAPGVETATVAMAITTSAGFLHAAVCALVQAAISAYINTLAVGASLSYTKLAQIAYESSPGVFSVTSGYTVNGATVDLIATNAQVIKAGPITVI